MGNYLSWLTLAAGAAREVVGQPVADYRVLRQPEVEAALDDALGELPEVGDDVELDLENKI